MSNGHQLMLKLPEPIWGRLATIAADRKTNVGQVIYAAVMNELQPRDRREYVLSLVRSGYPDRVVANMTGELRQYVAETRRRAGLPANKDRPAEAVTVQAGGTDA